MIRINNQGIEWSDRRSALLEGLTSGVHTYGIVNCVYRQRRSELREPDNPPRTRKRHRAKQPGADPVIAGYLVEGGWHGTSQKLAKTAEAIAS